MQETGSVKCTVALRFVVGLTAALVLLFDQHALLASEGFNRSFPEWFNEGEQAPNGHTARQGRLWSAIEESP